MSLLENLDNYANLITNEIGETLAESKAEVQKCAFLCDYYMQNAPHLLSAEKINYPNLNVECLFELLGVIYTIMPWNFPFWQVFARSHS